MFEDATSNGILFVLLIFLLRNMEKILLTITVQCTVYIAHIGVCQFITVIIVARPAFRIRKKLCDSATSTMLVGFLLNLGLCRWEKLLDLSLIIFSSFCLSSRAQSTITNIGTSYPVQYMVTIDLSKKLAQQILAR